MTNVRRDAPHRSVDAHRRDESYMTEMTDRLRLCHAPGFALSIVMGDFMHIVLLGVLPIAVACVILELCDEGRWQFEVITERNLRFKMQLQGAYCSFKAWASANHMPHSQPRFTVARLAASAIYDSPCLTAKAKNCMVVCLWLAALTANDIDNYEI